MLLAVVALAALPVYASQDRNRSDRSEPMDIMMREHKLEPVTTDRFADTPLVPKTSCFDSKL